MIDIHALFSTIKTTIKTIESELKISNNKGIFFAPELYIAFCLGFELFKERQEIFGTRNVEWIREANLGSGGPSDIYFKSDETNLVIELKLRDTGGAYQSDIEKLKRLPSNFEKFFCVLVDTIENKYDGRIVSMDAKFQNEIISVGSYSFRTWNNWYSSNVICSLILYKVI